MKKLFVFVLSTMVSLSAFSQKSKVIAVFGLIDNGKFEEAKEAIDESVKDEKTWNWPKTYYAKGYLCQKAYEKGKKDNKKELYELYPNQLYVAYGSYDKALRIDRTGRLDDQIAPLYVLLANEFLKEGEKQFSNHNYAEAFKAYEHALLINNSHILEVKTDTNLIYNTALAAYKAEEWEKAIEYLEILNEAAYSANIPHLLHAIYLHQKDTVAATEALINGVSRYKGDQNLVMLLVDQLVEAGEQEEAIEILDSVSVVNPENYVFQYAKGLALQTMEKYDEAIAAYKEAIALDPDRAKMYVNIGTCYYNKGVEIQENARTITSNSLYLSEKERAMEAFRQGMKWMEDAHDKGSVDPVLPELLGKIYRLLNIEKEVPGATH